MRSIDNKNRNKPKMGSWLVNPPSTGPCSNVAFEVINYFSRLDKRNCDEVNPFSNSKIYVQPILNTHNNVNRKTWKSRDEKKYRIIKELYFFTSITPIMQGHLYWPLMMSLLFQHDSQVSPTKMLKLNILIQCSIYLQLSFLSNSNTI